MIDLLKELGAEHILVFDGGGGVIMPRENSELMEYGVSHIYSPEDGRKLGLEGMIANMHQKLDFNLLEYGVCLDQTSLQNYNINAL